MTKSKLYLFANKVLHRFSEYARVPMPTIFINSSETDSIGIRGNKGCTDIKIVVNFDFIQNEIMESNTFEISKYVKGLNLDTLEKRLFFCLAHEIGHLIQWIRHGDWQSKYSIPPIMLHFMSDHDYRENKLEINADKIARILFKKFEAQLLTNA